MKTNRLPATATHAGATADIAFLLLVFFMVTTVIPRDEGLLVLLPPYTPATTVQPIPDRNLFRVQINSQDHLMVEGEQRSSLAGLRDELKKFILNESKDPSGSVHPEKAIVSLQADRGCSYSKYIEVLDELQAAYYEIYAARAGISVESFRKLDLSDEKDRAVYDRARKGIPMNISIAAPPTRR